MKLKFLIAPIMAGLFCISATASDKVLKVEELYAKKTELDGKSVIAKGKVVKKSSAILGKDWIHIQDNSKTPKKNTVIFTAKIGSANVSIGDTVTAKGTLKADVDIGSGYFYEVLIEDSIFSK